MNITRWMKALAMGLCGCVLLSVCDFQARCEEIASRVVRLHILANSDSEEDQATKLLVRDAVLEETAGMLDGVLSTALAKDTVAAMLPAIEEAANRCLADLGSPHRAQARICRMYFSTRYYETGALPAGEYDAVRIVIGEGQGQNWWCVVFPPMCVGGATEAVVADVLGEDQAKIVTDPERYEVRFKLVEWFYDICRWFS